ncbi:MAG: OmpA family protein [Rhodospirillales bacterium]|nr:OmpA family protein [Rhodospirillales bacterium]
MVTGMAIAVLGALSGQAHAQDAPITGLYVGAGVGANWMQSNSVQVNLGGLGVGQPAAGNSNIYFNTGFVALASVGWGFGNGLRAELEGSYRGNGVDKASGIYASPNVRAGGKEQKMGMMVNLLYDFHYVVPYVTPYIGAGLGYQWAKWGNVSFSNLAGNRIDVDNTQGQFAYQAIVGAAMPLPWVPGLAATAEYRFMGMAGNRNYDARGTSPSTTTVFHPTVRAGAEFNHAILLGVRYAFNQPPPPAPAPAPIAAPAPAPSRSYLVFFDWDKATLTDRARQIIKEAADNSTRVQYTRIEVNGYTDTSGTPKYNQGLSVRRAEAVAGELVRDGVPRKAISIEGFGDNHLLVATGPAVREPQNRRVEIIIR